MMKPWMKFTTAAAMAALLSGHAFAAPPMDTAQDVAKTVEPDVLTDELTARLQSRAPEIGQSLARIKRDLDAAGGSAGETTEAVADALEEAFSEGGALRELGSVFSGIIEDVDVETANGGTELRFDGAPVLRLEKRKVRDSEDELNLFGLGRAMKFKRETVTVDGKTKSRIVIEIDEE